MKTLQIILFAITSFCFSPLALSAGSPIIHQVTLTFDTLNGESVSDILISGDSIFSDKNEDKIDTIESFKHDGYLTLRLSTSEKIAAKGVQVKGVDGSSHYPVLSLSGLDAGILAESSAVFDSSYAIITVQYTGITGQGHAVTSSLMNSLVNDSRTTGTWSVGVVRSTSGGGALWIGSNADYSIWKAPTAALAYSIIASNEHSGVPGAIQIH
ncbi:hypothetical protein [Thalassomonas sp. RHCl1]|uniref:hypothetical protein n=1 Tax=Thalassomonas sp. RHCl1 TaxID=2995320 RepID=UPI00248CA309|nr:hypothetical protein [Thalassomonas sp. RHCl1]